MHSAKGRASIHGEVQDDFDGPAIMDGSNNGSI